MYTVPTSTHEACIKTMKNPRKKNLVVLVSAVSFTFCCSPLLAGTAEVVAVTVVPVKYERRSRLIKNSGRVGHKSEIRLSFKTGGLVQSIHVEEGDDVHSGQVLATLDLEEIDAQQQRAASNHDKALLDLERFNTLYDDELVSLQLKQDAQTASDNAAAELQIANFNRKLSVIRAPADGRILKRYVESYELIQPGQPVLRMAASEQGAIVRVGLIDRDIVKVALGDAARVSIDAYPDLEFSGAVSEVALSADAGAGTFEVEILIDEQGISLRSGLIARVEISAAASGLQFYIPVEAVVDAKNGDATLFVLDSKSATVHAVSVELVEFLQDEVAVRGSLNASDKVIKLGASYLSDGSTVAIVDES